MSPTDQGAPPFPPPTGGDDEIIELTEVVDVTPAEVADDVTAEVVLDFRAGSVDLESLKSVVKPMDEPQEAPPAAPPDESLNDFLASLPDLPEDLDITPGTPASQRPAAPPAPQDLSQELAERLSDAELKELVRQVIQETVERLARELFPEMAAEAIERELHLWKKRLTESD